MIGNSQGIRKKIFFVRDLLCSKLKLKRIKHYIYKEHNCSSFIVDFMNLLPPCSGEAAQLQLGEHVEDGLHESVLHEEGCAARVHRAVRQVQREQIGVELKTLQLN